MVKTKLLGGRYQLIKVIGYSGARETYLVADVKIPGYPKYVIKCLPLTNQNPHDIKYILEILESKVEILEKIADSQHVCKTIANFAEKSNFYLVREFIPGHSLATEIDEAKKFSESQLIVILKEILAILVNLREHNLIHSRLNPFNIIRHHLDRKLILTDLGVVEEAHAQITYPSKKLAQIDHILNQIYLPPEQKQLQPAENSDIYGLGMLAIHSLTGLSTNSLLKLKRTSLAHKRTDIWHQQASVSPQLAGIIDRMVHFDSQQRYQKVEEVLADLYAVKTPKVRVKPLPKNSKSQSFFCLPRPKNIYLAPMFAIALLAIPTAIYAPQIRTIMLYKNELNQGQNKENSGEDRLAIEHYSQAIDLDPNNSEAYYRRGLTYYNLHEDRLALADLTKAIQFEVQDAQIYYKRGNVRFTMGDRQGAIADYTTAVQLNPKLIDAYINRGFVYADLGNELAAIEDYSQAIKLDGSDPDVFLNRCLAFSNQGDQEAALLDCTKAINLQPNHAFAYQNRGLVRRRQKDFSGAIEDYNVAIKLSPHDGDPYYNRGLTREDLGDLQGAIADYTEAIRLDPNHALARYNRGLLYTQLGNHRVAKADFQQAAKLCLDMGRIGCYEDAQYQLNK